MVELNNENFIIYYEKKDENAAIDISKRLKKGYEFISNEIDMSPDYKTEVYIYKNLEEFHTKKYGFIGKFFAPEWYIGDNIKNKVIIVSPNSPGKQHGYEDTADAALHEYVHTLMWNINPKLSKFLNEGMAGYVSGNTRPLYKLGSIPSYEGTKISNPIEFGNSNMYPISYTYIEFLHKTYGLNKVMELVKTENYNEVFAKSEEEIYNDWIEFYKATYIK